MYKKITLDNGLRIVSNQMPDRHSLALGIWITAGGRYETSENKGISHFLEHLLFKGTKKYSCRKLKESIEGIGGVLNGFTSEELTCYLVKIPSRYLDLALNILSDMVLAPKLDPKEVTKEKTVILEEIKMYLDLPQSYVYELLDELMWPAQALGEPVTGTSESVSKITRDDLAAFRNKYYTPSNIVISVAGALEFSEFTKKVSMIFSKEAKSEKNKFLAVKEEQDKPKLKVFDKDTEQTHLAMGFHGLERSHPLRHALGLLHVILGANMSSRLFNEVREKRGLAYEIGTTVKRYHDTGAFIVHAGIDNSKVNGAIELILKELEKAKAKLVTDDEFRRAKEFYTGQLILALEDTLDHMLWIGESLAALDRIYTIKDIIKEVSMVKKEDLKDAANKILRQERLNLALIGPLKAKEEDINRRLKLN